MNCAGCYKYFTCNYSSRKINKTFEKVMFRYINLRIADVEQKREMQFAIKTKYGYDFETSVVIIRDYLRRKGLINT